MKLARAVRLAGVRRSGNAGARTKTGWDAAQSNGTPMRGAARHLAAQDMEIVAPHSQVAFSRKRGDLNRRMSGFNCRVEVFQRHRF